MTNAAEPVPHGATHIHWCYGTTYYYKRTTHRHLNQVSEEWQSLTIWFEWNRVTNKWERVSGGFRSDVVKALA